MLLCFHGNVEGACEEGVVSTGGIPCHVKSTNTKWHTFYRPRGKDHPCGRRVSTDNKGIPRGNYKINENLAHQIGHLMSVIENCPIIHPPMIDL